MYQSCNSFGDIGTFRQRKQAHGGGLLEGFLWHSCCQDNRIGCMQQYKPRIDTNLLDYRLSPQTINR